MLSAPELPQVQTLSPDSCSPPHLLMLAIVAFPQAAVPPEKPLPADRQRSTSHWRKALHPATVSQAEERKIRKRPGWMVILTALTRGHCCLGKAISATVLLNPSLKAASS